MTTVTDFVNFTTTDLKCTNKSEFPLNIIQYKNYVNQVNESIEVDKTILSKVKKGAKTIYNSGRTHCDNEESFSQLLEKISSSEDEEIDMDFDKISSGLCKFAVVMRDLSAKYKQLMQNLNSLIIYPLEMYLKSDVKHDMRKPFERALREYEIKAEKLKRDRLNALNRESPLTIYRPNGDDLFDFSEDLERERRMVQLALCEFLIKVHEMKARKGAELVQQLIDYYRAQTNFFKDSLSMMEHMGLFMNDLVSHIDEIKNHHTQDIQLLTGIRNELRNIIEKNKSSSVPSTQSQQSSTTGYSLYQPQGNKAYGTSKDGYLLKKSDGVVFGRGWQKRRVKVNSETLLLYHGDDSKSPVVLPMLTCHIRHPVEMAESPLCFILVSNNRQYSFRAEDEKSLEEWLAVLSNAKNAVFEQAMSLDDDGNASKDNYSMDGGIGGLSTQNNNNSSNNQYQSNDNSLYPNISDNMISSTISFNKTNTSDGGDLSPGQQKKEICRAIRRVEGNGKCADCNRPEPDWVSVNLGILICLECCGAHRELGVHNSRTQSLKMDTLYMSQLLLPRFIGNSQLNEVYEALITDDTKLNYSQLEKVDNNSAMKIRSTYIHQKYIEKKFVNKINADSPEDLRHDLLQAIRNFDVKKLLQINGESGDLMAQFTSEDDVDIGPLMNTSIHQLLWQQNQEIDELNSFLSNNSNPISTTKDVGSNSGGGKKRMCVYDMNWDDDDGGGSGQSNRKNNATPLVVLEYILQNTPCNTLKRINGAGDTILHQAVRMKQLDAVKIILRSGSIFSELINTKNNEGQTPVELATDIIDHRQISELLKLAHSNMNDKDNHQHHMNPNLQQQQQQQLSELLDELSIDWELWNLPHPPQPSSQLPTSTSEGDEFYKKSRTMTIPEVGSNKTIGSKNKSQTSPLVTKNELQNALKAMDEKKVNHNRSESVSSTRSDASSYVNFNHHHVQRELPPTTSSPSSSVDTTQLSKTSIHHTPSLSSTHKKDDKKSHGYKNLLSFNPDQKIGMKSSNHPWKDIATLPRKKSLKGPAPVPPKHTRAVSNQETDSGSSSSSNQTWGSMNKPPTIAPKPKSVDINTTPVPKQRSIKTPTNSISGSDTISMATLPRNMHSTNNKSPYISGSHEPVKERSNSNATNSNSLKQASQFSHSSDHIDVLLDVLEEPDRPLNAKEVIHVSNTQSEDIEHKYSSRPSSKLVSVGDRTKAKFNCEAENNDELSFKKGDIIIVTNKTNEPGWLEGYIENDSSRCGMFPGNFVDKL